MERPFGITLDVDRGYVYWTASTGDKIQRSNLDGSNVVDIVTNLGSEGGLRGIAVSPLGNQIYWVDGTHDEIRRAFVDGTGIETVVTGLDSPWDLLVIPEPSTALLLGLGLCGLGFKSGRGPDSLGG